MNELIKNRQFVTASSIAVAILAVFILFVYMPKRNAVKAIEKKLEKIDKEIEATRATVGDIRNLGKMLAAMQKELNDFRNRLPAEEELSSILSEITKIAKEYSIEVAGVRPSKPAVFYDSTGKTFEFNQKKVKKVIVEVRMNGSYRSLVECIKTLRDSSDILAVLESVSILRDEKAERRLNADFVLSIFVLG